MSTSAAVPATLAMPASGEPPAPAARHEPMLSVERIRTFHGETQVLFDVSLEVAAGEVVALLGPNGAGKTTTLRSILGLTPARSGVVRFDGRDVTRQSTHEIARSGIGWVPDDRRIFPTLTVARNLAIARKRTPFRAWSEKDCFEIFSALEYLMHRECENLSGGEMQMVSISRALIGAPGLVLFDEPSQGLAPKVVQDVMKTIARLRAEGIAVLLVEQNVHSALAVADRTYVMNGGVIVHHGTAAQLRDDPGLRRRLLGV
jgi:branched-chain amino acid transport system ATP-binding protein